MLESLTPEILRRIIDLAQKNDAARRKWDLNHGIRVGATMSPSDVSEKWLMRGLDFDEHWALFGILSALSKDELAELKAVMWLGRGDEYDSKEAWPKCLEHARSNPNDGDIGYIMEKSPLVEYLTDGLKTLGYDG